jgi:hypothetical protein
MIESIADSLSFVVLASCFGLAVVRALRTRSTAWLMIVLFYGCMLMGNAYWLGYLLVFGETPRYSNISELSWIAAYVFLLMLEIESDRLRAISAPVPVTWIPVVACAVCGVYFIANYGSVLINIADEGLLGAAGYFAVRGLVAQPEDSALGGLAYNRRFHAAVLVFVFVELALWVASCFVDPGPIQSVNAYIVLNYALALSTISILVCAWKSDDL